MPHSAEYSIQLFPVWLQNVAFTMVICSQIMKWLDHAFCFLQRRTTLGAFRWVHEGATWLGNRIRELTDDPIRYPGFRAVQRAGGYTMAVVAYSLALMVFLTGLIGPLMLVGQPKLSAAMIVGVGVFVTAYTVVAKIIWVQGSRELVKLHPELAKLERVAKHAESRRKPRPSRLRPGNGSAARVSDKSQDAKKQASGSRRSSAAQQKK